ncbi:DUF2285 domain-containing protein [Algihabitans albus]|uniref:DUF2285 domain-containing protein n=1 Tax=Algihabitans albus TaxID=2164067 RepID=UPI000E5D57BC|nr:DUF2285 domain-containing protein [Algihabitans albus]
MAAQLRQTGGCDFPVDPNIAAPTAPVFWRPDIAPAAVSLIAPLPDVGIQSAPLSDMPIADTRRDSQTTYLKLESGSLLVGNLSSDDKPIGVLLPFDEQWCVRLAAAERLRHLLLYGRASAPPLTEQQRKRIKYALRVTDGLRQNASYRTIAVRFFGRARVDAEHWKTSALKAQVARLATHGAMLTHDGYRALLAGKRPTARSQNRR